MNVRRATTADLDDLTRLIAEFRDWFGKDEPAADAIHATLARLVEDPATEYLLAIGDGGAAVGVVQLRYRLSVWTGSDDCWLEDLFVREHARGGGHGHALLEAALESARARGCKRVELDVNVENETALAFYTDHGFTTEPKPPGRTLYISRRL